MSDWHTNPDPAAILAHSSAVFTDRLTRLVAVGFIRTVPHLVRTTRSRVFLEKLDEYARGELTRTQLELFQDGVGPTPAERAHDDGRVGGVLWGCGFPSGTRPEDRTYLNLGRISWEIALADAADRAGPAPADTRPGAPWHVAFQGAWTAARASHADVIRCAVPPRPAAFDPSWRTSTVVAVAQQARATGDPAAMPVLADALQDAGCDDEELLTHLRTQPRHHACCRGLRTVTS